MGYVTLCGPRQHPEEPVYAEQEPISTYFRQQADRHLSRTQIKVLIDELVSRLQSPQYEQKWVSHNLRLRVSFINSGLQAPIIQNWIKYCLDLTSLLPEPATKLFVRVLWANSRFNLDAVSHNPPLVLMEKAQNQAVQSPIVRCQFATPICLTKSSSLWNAAYHGK
jgi:hypothetical protein